MILALVADIHSNLHALEKASRLITGLSADAVLCAGDIVGYGAFPNECCSAVERLRAISVAGNHDRAAVSRDVSGMNPYAAAAALWTADHLDDRSKAFLSTLGPSARFDAESMRVAVFHGSPTDPDEYVEEEDVTEALLDESDCDVVVMGHTHRPYTRRFDRGLVVNPGSVGQPRDGEPRGSFAIIDTETLECETVRFEYPIQEAGDSIRSAGLPHILAERLSVGR